MTDKEPLFDATKFEEDKNNVKNENQNSNANKPILKSKEVEKVDNKIEDENLKIQKSEEKTLKNHENSEKNKENFAKTENYKNKTSLKQQLLSKLNIFGIFVLVITALVLMFFRYYIISIVCVILAYIWFRVFAYFINKNKIDDDKGKK